jgi:hypothetical protein
VTAVKAPSTSIVAGVILAVAGTGASAQEAGEDQAAELARKLANPIASLISVPIKYTWETGIGPEDLERDTLIVQPVIPLDIGPDWNLIIRTIIPYVDAKLPAGRSASGTGDIV